MDNFNGQNNDNMNNMFGNVQDNFGQASDNMNNQMNNFGQQMDNVQNQMDNFGNQMDNQMNNFGQQMDNMQGQMNNFGNQKDNQMNNFGQQMDNMQGQMNNFGNQMDNMQGQMNNFGNQMDNQMNNFGQQMDNMQGQMNNFGNQMDNQMNNFGQQMDNMQGQMAGFGQGVNAMQNPYPVNGPSGNPPKTKKSMSKGAKIGLISGLAVLVALIVCAVIFIPKFVKKPKDIVKDAMKNTFGEGNNANADFLKKFEEEGGSATIKIGAGSGLAEYNLDGYDIAMDINADAKEKKGNVKLYANYNNKELLGLDVYADQDYIYVGSEQLIDGYLRLPSINNIDQLKSFLRDLGVDEATLSQLDNIGSSTESVEVSEDMINDMNKAIDKFSDSIQVEKKGKKKVDVNGKSVSTKEYEVTVTKDAMSDLIKDIIDIALKQDSAQDALAQSGVDSETIKSAIGMIVPGDFKCTVYVAKNKVVKMTSEAASNVLGTNVGYKFNLDIDDNDLGLLFEISAAGETISVTADMKDYKKAPNGSVKATVAGQTAEVLVTSSMDGNKLDESFELKLNGVSYMVMSISETAGKPSSAAVDSSKKTYDVVSMSQNDYQTLLSDNMDKITKWAEDVVENGGPLISNLISSGMGELIEEMPDVDETKDEPKDEPKDDDKASNAGDNIISSGDLKVKIKGCIDGFSDPMVSGDTATFSSNDGISIAYVVYPKDDSTANMSDLIYDQVVSLFDTDEVVSDETSKVKVDDIEIECRVVKIKDDTLGDYNVLFAYREVEGSVMAILSYDFSDGKLPADKFAQALSSKYYEVVK